MQAGLCFSAQGPGFFPESFSFKPLKSCYTNKLKMSEFWAGSLFLFHVSTTLLKRKLLMSNSRSSNTLCVFGSHLSLLSIPGQSQGILNSLSLCLVSSFCSSFCNSVPSNLWYPEMVQSHLSMLKPLCLEIPAGTNLIVPLALSQSVWSAFWQPALPAWVSHCSPF